MDTRRVSHFGKCASSHNPPVIWVGTFPWFPPPAVWRSSGLTVKKVRIKVQSADSESDSDSEYFVSSSKFVCLCVWGLHLPKQSNQKNTNGNQFRDFSVKTHFAIGGQRGLTALDSIGSLSAVSRLSSRLICSQSVSLLTVTDRQSKDCMYWLVSRSLRPLSFLETILRHGGQCFLLFSQRKPQANVCSPLCKPSSHQLPWNFIDF